MNCFGKGSITTESAIFLCKIIVCQGPHKGVSPHYGPKSELSPTLDIPDVSGNCRCEFFFVLANCHNGLFVYKLCMWIFSLPILQIVFPIINFAKCLFGLYFVVASFTAFLKEEVLPDQILEKLLIRAISLQFFVSCQGDWDVKIIKVIRVMWLM